jgi:hypothetical protein
VGTERISELCQGFKPSAKNAWIGSYAATHKQSKAGWYGLLINRHHQHLKKKVTNISYAIIHFVQKYTETL